MSPGPFAADFDFDFDFDNFDDDDDDEMGKILFVSPRTQTN